MGRGGLRLLKRKKFYWGIIIYSNFWVNFHDTKVMFISIKTFQKMLLSSFKSDWYWRGGGEGSPKSGQSRTIFSFLNPQILRSPTFHKCEFIHKNWKLVINSANYWINSVSTQNMLWLWSCAIMSLKVTFPSIAKVAVGVRGLQMLDSNTTATLLLLFCFFHC